MAAWFQRLRINDFDPLAGNSTLLQRVNAIPLDYVPEGRAREQLRIEARAGGPLIDVYRSSGYSDDYHAANGRAYIIERPMHGRHDSRWPAAEWIAWVEAGMFDTPCMTCGEPPATFALPEEYRTVDCGRVFICYGCNSAHLGVHGYTPHAILNPCPLCGNVGLQVDENIPYCVLCWRKGRRFTD